MAGKNKIPLIRTLKKITIPLLVFIISICLYPHCKNPKDYEPPFDSLYPPPSAPQLISPRNDTSFWFETPFPNEIKLKWSIVEDVEYYQLQIANDTTLLPSAPLLEAEECSTTYTVGRNSYYFWRVRAYSRKWTWYTEWSTIWHFGAFYAP